MKICKFLLSALAASTLLLSLPGCGGGTTEPLIVMKNPDTGEETYFYRQNKRAMPHGYDEATHIRQWRAQEGERGFTEVVADRSGN